MVAAAEVADLAIVVPDAEIAGQVQALARHGAERVGAEAVCRQVRQVAVAARDADAADGDFSRHSGRDRVAPVVQQVEGAARHRAAQDRLAGKVGAGFGRGADGGLRRAIGVDDVADAAPGPQESAAGGLSRHDDRCEVGKVRRVECGQDGRGQRDVGGPRADQMAADVQGVGRVGRQAQRGAARQRVEDFGDGGVEAGRGELVDAAAGTDPEGFGLGRREVGDAGMRDHDALGASGRARRVDDIGERQRIDVGQRAAFRRVGAGDGEVERPAAWGAEFGRQRAVGQHQRRAAVFQHVRQAVRRVSGVERQPRRRPPSGSPAGRRSGRRSAAAGLRPPFRVRRQC